MAPPPSANLPLTERIVILAKTLQFGWFTGHLVLLLCITRYSLSWIRMNYYTRMAQFSYRTAFIAAAATYGIVVYKTMRARQKVGAKYPSGGALGLAADENVQYLVMALVWLFMPQYPLAMLPYGIYSIFHVATYTRANVIPTIQPAKPAAGASSGAKAAGNPIADAIGSFVKTYYDASMSVVSFLEIALWGRIFLSAIIFQRRSWILIVIYTVFLRARFSQSSHVQHAFATIEARIDSAVGAQNLPPVARQIWETVKNVARQFHSATDISKYMNGASVPKKTS
ncbi:uncharacterized protein BCR38DRAFT_341382 [Pseudomassariella vexata]|uniref:Endoplasmic reticulum protein n=1 Tax=Pseudomassariella vexata TaxID=1141098 RepID=A0A1Y2DZY1_9PEZI|nr:uncharacterized protein BCR38DRAFT_341382 [Pseudomassariella vexata]ORY64852.1 hypothetical protein BCR38DRAFT_341382 [Pseudomassariella vexata]